MAVSTEEVWKPVPGFKGGYEVSDLGRVRSLDRVVVDRLGRPRRLPGRVLKPGKRPDGRMQVVLGSTAAKVHQLVLLAFVGPRPERQVSRHLNNVPQDNRLTNLAYGTYSENASDKTHCINGHPYTAANTYRWPAGHTRRCRECFRLSAANYRARRKAVVS